MLTILNRRKFCHSLGLTAIASTVPRFLEKTGSAIDGRDSADDRVLVVIQLGGGNDGLNTVVPFEDSQYYKARPKIAVDATKVLKISDRLGFHPEMVELHRLYSEGALAVIPNVGYPNPNRSHFRSTDIWETGSPSGELWKTGWLGRYFDAACKGESPIPPGIRIGENPSLAFAGDKLRAATFANPRMLENPAEGIERSSLDHMKSFEKTGISSLDFVQRVSSDANRLSLDLQRAARDVRPKVTYPPFALCQSLRLVSQMITAGFPTKVYYVSHGGFDTHAAQPQKQAYLLQELSEAVGLFHQDLKAQGQLHRVLGFTFSEFGRRVAENKNAGTDHGAASVMFAFGGKIKPGFHGEPPKLDQLDDLGDLRHETDFRQVYAGVIQDWLGADPTVIVGRDFPSFRIVNASS